MPWYVRKSVKMGPMRLNFSKRGIGMSVGVRGLRVGTGPRGPYVSGGRGGVYFRQSLRAERPTSAATPRRQPNPAGVPPAYVTMSVSGMQQSPVQQPAPMPFSTVPPPTTVSQPAPVPPPPRSYRAFSMGLLVSLSTAQILGWVLMFADSGSQSGGATTAASSSSSFGPAGTIGMLLFLASVVAVCAMDWHGFVSLRGRIPWWRLSGAQKFWIVCAYIFVFEIMVPIYLVCAWIDFQRAKAQAPLQLRLRTAEMEAQLGYQPPTEGICRACGKPLQVGAEFCGYCRAPVVEKPKVCPQCATTALPDATWCPHCGAALP
ncbi:MAG TPA: DUF4236 domain-containing protein [Ktedonobacterales bacterium]